MDFLSWLPASLPGIILGLALLSTFLNIPLFRPLYGTIAMLVIGETRPLSMLQVDNMVDRSFEAAAVVGTLIVIMTLSVAGIARMIARRMGFSGLSSERST